MIAEEKKKAVLTAIEQLEDEAAFEKIAAVVAEVLRPAKMRAPLGFAKGSITYLVDDWDAPVYDAVSPDQGPRRPLAPPGFAAGPDFWMADDFDEPLEDFKDY